MTRRASRTAANQPLNQGFTIVELLIVIVVIAVLATVTVMSYNGIRAKANDAAVQLIASQAAKRLTSHATISSDAYPDAAGENGIDNLSALGITNSDTTSYEYSANNSASPRTFCLTATINNVSYHVSNTLMTPQSGGCPGHGANGIAAVTNYHPNPGTLSGWHGYSSYVGASGNVRNDTTETVTWSQSGRALRTTWTSVASPNTGDISAFIGQLVEPGKRYTAVYKIHAPNKSIIVSSVGTYTSTGSVTVHARSHSSDVTLSANQVQTRWVTYTLDAAAVGTSVRAVNSVKSKVVGDYIELSDVIIYEGNYNPAIGWASGSTPNWIWNGTANYSTSRGPIVPPQ